MRSGKRDGEWFVTDRFGDAWRLWIARVDAKEDDAGAEDDEAARTRREATRDDACNPIGHLIFQAFDDAGALDREIAAALLAAYDAVTGARLAEELPDPLHDRRGLLRRFAPRLKDALSAAVDQAALRFERIAPAAWRIAVDDRPDVPPVVTPPAQEDETRTFTLRLVDDVGKAIAGAKLTFVVAGDKRDVSTDSGGVAKIDAAGAATGTARFADVEGLRDVLQPRWRVPRAAALPAGDVQVREIADAIDPVALRGDVEQVVAIVPHFRCVHVEGAHFAFGRSFVLPAAAETLAEIAEALTGGQGRRGMIFGHTDRAGPELLNKELSERRARSVHALLTQDADAWLALVHGKDDARGAGHWRERWGPYEAKVMLNALGVTSDDGAPLAEDDRETSAMAEAVRRFQAGDYAQRPPEQAPLAPSGRVDDDTQKELFLAYAKRIAREPVDAARIAKVNGAPYMGCGEFNALSAHAKDEESRRVTIFVFDRAAEPRGLPCKLRSLGPCHAQLSDPPPDAPSPFRCRVFRDLGRCCPPEGGEALDHPLLVRIPFPLRDTADLAHELILESDDETISISKKVASDARALTDGASEIEFTDVPPAHAYRLTCVVDGRTDVLFDYTPYDELPNVVVASIDAGAVDDMSRHLADVEGEADADADDVDDATNDDASDGGEGGGAGGDAPPAQQEGSA